MLGELALKLLPYLIAAGLTLGGVWWHSNKINSFGEVKFKEGSHATQEKWDKANQETTRQELEAHKTNAETVRQLGVERNEKLKALDDLAVVNAKYDRLRLHPPSRTGGLSSAVNPSPDPTSSGNATGNRDVHAPVPDGAEEALNEFDTSCRAIALTCDKLVEDVRPVLKWATELRP